jgi:hypothetical protein
VLVVCADATEPPAPRRTRRTEHDAQTGLAEVDLSVWVLVTVRLDLPFAWP